MSLSRQPHFDPFRRAMNDVFNTMERDMLSPWGVSSRMPVIEFPSSALAPARSASSGMGMDLDFHETAKGYELTADLPGMTKEDITIDVDNDSGVLTVTGERKNKREEKGDEEDGERKYHFIERSYGKMTRSIRLPETADTSKANAAYVDGVLKLTFPKMEPPEHRRLQIPIGDGQPSIEGGKSGEKEESMET